MRYLLILFLCFFTFSCSSSDQVDTSASSENQASKTSDDISESSENFQAFYVFKDKGARENHYTPSGFMPNGDCIDLDDSWQENCYSGSSCIQINYDPVCSREGEKWGGIYWLNPPNNWGRRKGGYNLTGAKRLTFYARGERGGEHIAEFTIGGINGDYADSDTVVFGPVILSDEWKKYAIDLNGKDLSHISGGFSWTTNEEVNEDSCLFYLDEIRFE